MLSLSSSIALTWVSSQTPPSGRGPHSRGLVVTYTPKPPGAHPGWNVDPPVLTGPPAPEPFAAQTWVPSVPRTPEEPAVWPVSGPARWPLPRRCRGLGTASGHGVRPERRGLLPHVADGRQLPPSAHGEAPSWASPRRRAGRPPLGAHRPAGSLATDRAFNEPIAQLRAAENAGLLSCPLRPRGPPRPGQAGQSLPGVRGSARGRPSPSAGAGGAGQFPAPPAPGWAARGGS